MNQLKDIKKVATYAVEHFSCLICGDSPVYGGAFIPGKASKKRYGAKPGKDRALGYALCEKCKGLPDRDARVKATLLFLARKKKNMDMDMDMRVFSTVQQEELVDVLKGQPCTFCNSWTDIFLHRELDERESADLGVGVLAFSLCKCCMDDPCIHYKLEEQLRELRKKSRNQKQGEILSFRPPAKKKRWMN